MSILGAKHAVSVLFVWFLADLGIALVLSFCTAGLLGKIFYFIISSVFEYETGWAFHNVVSYY